MIRAGMGLVASTAEGEGEVAAARSLRRQQGLTLSLLFAAGVINFFDRSSLSMANATIRTELHLSATEMGWLLSAFSLAYGIAQLPLAGLMQRAGTRSVLGVGLGLWSTAQLLTGLVRSLPPFLVLRVLLGVGESPFYPCGVGSVRDWFPERTRGRATAVMSMSQTLGLAVAPPVLSLLMLAIGWRATFMVLGGAGLVVALAWSTLYRARAATEHAATDLDGRRADARDVMRGEAAPAVTARWAGGDAQEGVGTGGLARESAVAEGRAGTPAAALACEGAGTPGGATGRPARAGVWGRLLRQRTVWGMMLGFGGINYTNWLYTAWLPGYLQSARHLSLARTGSVAAIPFLAGALGMFASGVTTDWLARAGARLTTVHRGNIVVGMVFSAGSTFAVARSGSTAHAVAGISAALFFIHFAGTSGWGYVQAVSPARWVASMSALQNFASFMIASAAPVLTGSLLDRTHSFTVALGVCSGVTLLGALSYATLAAPPRGAMLPE